MRVGGVGTARHNRAKGQAVGAVGEHIVLELVANLLLGHAGLNKAEHVLEGGIGDRLRMAHELDLLGVLDSAHLANVVMHQRQHAGDGTILQTTLNALVEVAGPAVNSDMQIPFLLSQKVRDESQPNDGIAYDPQPIGNPPLNMIRKTMDVNKS